MILSFLYVHPCVCVHACVLTCARMPVLNQWTSYEVLQLWYCRPFFLHYNIEFCKAIEIVSEQSHIRRCTTTHSKADIALMFRKIKVLQSDLRKLWNYAMKY